MTIPDWLLRWIGLCPPRMPRWLEPLRGGEHFLVVEGPPGNRDVHFSWLDVFTRRLRLRSGILWPTPRKRRMVSMNLGTEIGFDK
jgi:hypothetical protein